MESNPPRLRRHPRGARRAKGAAVDDDDEARVAEVQARLAKKDPRATATLVISRPKGGSPTPTLKLSVSLAAFFSVFGRARTRD